MRIKKSKVSVESLFGAILFCTAAVITSCGSPLEPFNPSLVNQVKDTAAPVVEIVSPASDSVYSQTVTVSGTVTDDGAVMPELTYTVSDSLGSQEKTGSIELIQLEADEGIKSSFSFQFTTSEYTSDILLEINGTDWNNNISEPAKLRLIFPGNTIPSFTAAAASKTIACSWGEVEGASSYRIFYTTDGSIPYENYGESTPLLPSASTEASPYVIGGLANGSPHIVRLFAYSDDGESWSSELKTVVPLSSLSLRPKASAGYNEINLEWEDSSDLYGYELYRGEGADGVPINISGTITGNSFTDTRVEEDVDYYYYVKPSVANSVLSAGTACSSFPLVPGGDRTISSLLELNSIEQSTVYGTRAYLLNNAGNLYIYDIGNPEDTVLLGSWENPSTSTGWSPKLAVKDNYVYISKSFYIYRLDVSDPSLPVLTDTVQPEVTSTCHVNDIHIQGSKLYATVVYQTTAANEGIYCYNIETDGSLNLGNGWYTAHDFPNQTMIESDSSGSGDLFIAYYYASTYATGVLRVTSSGTKSDLVPSITTDAGNDYTTYRGVAVDVDKGLAVCIKRTDTSYSLEYYNIATGASCGPEQLIDITFYRDSYIGGEMLYLAESYYMNAFILNKSGADYSTVELYDVPLQSYSVGLDPYGDVSVCGIGNGIQLIDTERKQASSLLGPALDVNAHAVAVSGDLVFVGENNSAGTLAAYSFADKSNSIFIGRSTEFDSSYVRAMVLAGDYAFLSTFYAGVSGVFVIDVSNPAEMKLAGSFDLGTQPFGMDIFGDYLAAFCNGFIEILDVSDPASISRVSKTLVADTGSSGDIKVQGEYLFTGFDNYSPSSGLTVMDISNPAFPLIKKELVNVQMKKLVVSGDRLYGYSKFHELVAYDISNPENPQHLQDISCIIDGSDPLESAGLDAVGDYLFFHGCPDGDNYDDDGVHIFNTENTSVTDRLEFMDLYDEDAGEEGWEGEARISGRYLYVAADKLMCFNIAP